MSEQTVYGAATDSPAEPKPRIKVRTHHLLKWKSEGHKWAMLTAYDYSTARIFDDAGKLFEQFWRWLQPTKARSRLRQPSSAISWRFNGYVVEHD